MSAPAMPPIRAPGTVGTCRSVICAAFSDPRFTITIWLLPDCATNAWLVAGSTARPPNKVRLVDVPPAVTVICEVPEFAPGSLVCAWKVARSAGLVGSVRQAREGAGMLQANATRCRVEGFEMES